MGSARSTIWRFYAYRISVSNGFYLPVSVLYLRRVREFGLDDVGMIMAGFSVAMVLAEIPTGYVGDRLGRRASLVLGNVIIATFMLGYTVIETPIGHLLLHAFWAFGWAFRSGTADAWLYELLAAGGEEREFTRIRGRATTVELAFEAVTAAAAGVLVVYGWSLPFLANAAVAALGVPLLLTSPRAPGETGDPAAATPSLTVREAVETLVVQGRRPDVRWFVAYVVLFSTLYQVTRVFEQPALESVGIPVAGFGLLYAGLKLVAGGAAATAGWIGNRFGARTVFAALVPLWGIAFLCVALAPIAIVPVVFLNRSVKAVIRPVRNQYLNDRLDDVGRATVLSGVSMVAMLAGGVGKVIAGQAAETIGLLRVLVVGGVAVAVLGGILWATTSPFRPDGTDRSVDALETASSD